MTYRILTHDVLADRMTPQEGVPEIVIGWAGLRRALRTLRGMGYEARRGDARISVAEVIEIRASSIIADHEAERNLGPQ